MKESTISVLLVDDDPHVCTIFELVMNHHQMPLVVAGDAEEALVYLQTHTPDIVVLDLFLPGVDGYHALDQIRTTALEPNCRVVATTAYYTNDTRQEVMRRGFDGFLAKPFEAETLADYLVSIVEQR